MSIRKHDLEKLLLEIEATKKELAGRVVNEQYLTYVHGEKSSAYRDALRESAKSPNDKFKEDYAELMLSHKIEQWQYLQQSRELLREVEKRLAEQEKLYGELLGKYLEDKAREAQARMAREARQRVSGQPKKVEVAKPKVEQPKEEGLLSMFKRKLGIGLKDKSYIKGKSDTPEIAEIRSQLTQHLKGSRDKRTLR